MTPVAELQACRAVPAFTTAPSPRTVSRGGGGRGEGKAQPTAAAQGRVGSLPRSLPMVADDARTGVPPGVPGDAICVRRLDDSLSSAIHITYRSLPRSSSMPEPRDPLLKVFSVSLEGSRTCNTGHHLGAPTAHRWAPGTSGVGRDGIDALGRDPWVLGNDPSAGSPTETLLRLLLPLNDRV